MNDYSATTNGILVVDGVKVDISVQGDEDKAEKVMMDLKDRLGWIATAYEEGVPPEELEDRPAEYTPLMSVNWDKVFDDE